MVSFQKPSEPGAAPEPRPGGRPTRRPRFADFQIRVQNAGLQPTEPPAPSTDVHRSIDSFLEITAAVEVDFGAGPYERVDIRYGEDPVKLSSNCQDKGFSQTIMSPWRSSSRGRSTRPSARPRTSPRPVRRWRTARSTPPGRRRRRRRSGGRRRTSRRSSSRWTKAAAGVSIAELQALLKSSETVRILGLTSIIVFDPKTDKMVVQRKLTEFLQRWDKGGGLLSKGI